MLSVKKALSSSLGQKFIMALSGLALVGFVIVHLLGNLTLYAPSSEPFNLYVKKLYSLGPLLPVAEIGLLVLFLVHIVTAICVTRLNKQARPESYDTLKSKGGLAQSCFFTRNMIVSGMALLAFLIFHLWQFRWGPGMNEGYVATLEGAQVRDLYRLVIESFQKPWVVLVYLVSMFLLAAHLKHGFWSAFQSLGATNSRTSGVLKGVGYFLAILLAVGFLLIPVWIYFNGGALS